MQTLASLRQHHMVKLNPHLSFPQMRLGEDSHMRKGAALFEQAMYDFLHCSSVEHYNEREQRAHNAKHLRRQDCLPPTPGSVLKNLFESRCGIIH